MYLGTIPQKSYKILEKEKYTSHTIARPMVFMHAFYHMHVENLLKGLIRVLKFHNNLFLLSLPG